MAGGTAAGAAVVGGDSRLYAVLGDPVAQVRAPGLLNPLLARLRPPAVLVPVLCAPGDLAGVVRGLQQVGNLDGLLVTVPHKIAVCRFADRLSPAVLAAGSANALRREEDGTWSAENFDGAGFVAGLTGAGHDPAGRRVALVGAGGAGAAVAAALLAAGAAELRVTDPDPHRLAALLSRLAERWPGRAAAAAEPDLGGADIAVNATPLGMRAGDPLPFSPAGLPPGRLVADVVMTPAVTPLLRAAAALGHQVHPGRHMLEQQLPLYLDFFRLTGARPAAPAGGHRGG